MRVVRNKERIFLRNIRFHFTYRFHSHFQCLTNEFVCGLWKIGNKSQNFIYRILLTSQKDSNSSSDSQLASQRTNMQIDESYRSNGIMKENRKSENQSSNIWKRMESTLHNLITRMKDMCKKVNNRLKIDNMESKKISTRTKYHRMMRSLLKEIIKIIKNCRPNDLHEYNTKNGNHTNGNSDMTISEVSRPLSTIIESSTIVENNNDRILNGISMELYYSILTAHEFEKMTDINCRRLLQLLCCCHPSSSISIVVTSMKLMKLLLLLIPVQMALLLKLIFNELFLKSITTFLLRIIPISIFIISLKDVHIEYKSIYQNLEKLLKFSIGEVLECLEGDNQSTNFTILPIFTLFPSLLISYFIQNTSHVVDFQLKPFQTFIHTYFHSYEIGRLCQLITEDKNNEILLRSKEKTDFKNVTSQEKEKDEIYISDKKKRTKF
ncbi:hypothetical protein SNEBB_002888 [Seison nebaliae]|nr:hypothetical protein SNEBB_002888 [Seison nebaliae]